MEMPLRRGAIFAVGYSPVYMNIKSSWQEARRNGLLNLAKAYWVSIRGQQAFVSGLTGTAYRGSTLSVEVDSIQLKMLKSKLTCLDSAQIGGMVIVLVSTKEIAVDNTPAPSKSKPTWIEKLPFSPDYDYARGVSPKYLHESNSWLEAERRARIQLAWEQRTKLQQLRQKGKLSFHQVTVESTGVILREAQIVARWIDPETGVHWVLARCPKRTTP